LLSCDSLNLDDKADFGITKSAHAKMLFDDEKITQKVLYSILNKEQEDGDYS
jgi:hypothetical protein